MKKRILALIFIATLLLTALPVCAEENAAAGTQSSEAVQLMPEPAAQATAAPVKAPAEDAPAAAPFTAVVRIELKNKGALHYGDEITLRAVVTKASGNYTVRWEYFDVEADVEKGEKPWVKCGKGEEYSFTADRENAALTYRAVVNDSVISEKYTLPAITVAPEADPAETEATEPESEAEEIADAEEPAEEAPAEEDEVIEEEESSEEEVVAEEEPAEEEVPEEEVPEEESAEEEASIEEEVTEEEPAEEEVTEEEPAAEASAPELDPDRNIAITAEWEGDVLHFGDACTLAATLNGYDNAVYTLQWQTSADGVEWVDVEDADGASYTMIVTEENYLNYWRVNVTVLDILPEANDAE